MYLRRKKMNVQDFLSSFLANIIREQYESFANSSKKKAIKQIYLFRFITQKLNEFKENRCNVSLYLTDNKWLWNNITRPSIFAGNQLVFLPGIEKHVFAADEFVPDGKFDF